MSQNAASLPPAVPVALPSHRESARNSICLYSLSSHTTLWAALSFVVHELCPRAGRQAASKHTAAVKKAVKKEFLHDFIFSGMINDYICGSVGFERPKNRKFRQ